MSGRCFFDTSVLVYTVTEDPRGRIADGLLANGGYLSVQVLNEFASVARRKLGMSWEEIGASLDAVRTLCQPPIPVSLTTHTTALRLAARYGYAFYDSVILAAALEAKCDTFYAEDLQDGQTIEELTIRNPFGTA
jgi:predicted nucleic acid-binding protein